jgi:hypothetical protein
VVSGRIDKLLEVVAGDHVAVVDEDGPDLDEDKKGEIEVFLHRADEDEDAGARISERRETDGRKRTGRGMGRRRKGVEGEEEHECIG